MNGVSPILASILRWVAIIVLQIVLSIATLRQQGQSWEQAITATVIVVAPVLLGALGWGGYDQSRFNSGKTLDSDVKPAA